MPITQKVSHVAPEMSDLFFNHTHEHFDALACTGEMGEFNQENGGEPEEDEMEVAILADALEFVHNYSKTCEFWNVTADDLVTDFLSRL
jgi:hypothetical protein